MYFRNILIEGTLSQIFYLGISFVFVYKKKKGGHF